MERLYNGIMTVYEYSKTKLKTGQTSYEKIMVLDNIPCHLSSISSSRSVIRESVSSDYANKYGKLKKVFLSSEYTIKPGSFVSILQDGRLEEFSYTSDALFYEHHQEIYLENTNIA